MYIFLLSSLIFLVLFFLVEICVAVEPVLPPILLAQKVPILIGASNALVAVCNLSVTYFFPMWFQTVMLSSASTAGMTVGQIHKQNIDAGRHSQDYTFYRTVSVSLLVRYLLGNLIFDIFCATANLLAE